MADFRRSRDGRKGAGGGANPKPAEVGARAIAVRVLDRGRLRRRNGWRTAAERDRGRRVRYSPDRGEALWMAVRAAEEEAMRSYESARDRARAVREAKLRVLGEFGVLFRTRAGVPYRRGEAEIIS